MKTQSHGVKTKRYLDGGSSRPGFALGLISLLVAQAAWVQPALGQTSFRHAILTKQSIKLNGGIVIDSFDSQDPTKSTNGLYDPTKRQDGGNVGSTSDTVTEITETGSARVYGHAATGPLGRLITAGGASIGSLAWVDSGNRGIQPGWSSNNLLVGIPDVQLPSLTFVSLPQIGGTVNGTNYTYVLASGNYRSTAALSLSGSQSMAIVGNVVLYFQNKLNLSGSAYIYVAPGSKLTVYLADDAQLSGRGIVNGTGEARNCNYFGLPSCTALAYSGNSGFVGTIYAPQADVKLSGGGSTGMNFIGAAVGNSADVSGNYQFHYDESLANQPPVANDDAYTIREDSRLAMSAPGVLNNDSDIDEDTLSAVLVSDPAHGSVVLSADGSFNYLPADNYSGSDSFTYRAFDGKTNSNIATVRLTINPVNHQPVAATDSYTTPEDTALTISAPGVLANDHDPDGDALTALLASNPTHGALTFSSNGNFSYLPNAHFTGLDSFTYLAFDGHTNAILIATVSITVMHVNHQPVAANDAYTTLEDTALTLPSPGVFANDYDPDGDALTALLASRPLHGTLTFSMNGGFTYVPDAHFTGPDSFTYLALDGKTNSTLIATVAIMVNARTLPVAPQDVSLELLHTNNTIIVEFDSLSNHVYVVQYSPDLVNWKSAEPPVTGDGGVVQWIDDGPPKTDSAPMTQKMRFYRLMLLP